MDTHHSLVAADGCTLPLTRVEWNAMRVPRSAGIATLKALSPRIGAVLETSDDLYFFIAPGTRKTVATHVPDTWALSVRRQLSIPPSRRTQGPGPVWHIHPDINWHTDGAALLAALRDVSTFPDWIPDGGGVRWTRVGELGWHALTLPLHLGNRVLAQLGDTSGAVIQEDIEPHLTWLIEPNAPAVQHLRADDRCTLAGDDGSFLFVPGMTRDHLVWWRITPEPDRLLTDAPRLADAITTTLHHRTPGGAAR